MVDDAPSLAVKLVKDSGEVIGVLAEGIVTPDRIEICLVQGILDPVDLLDGIWRSTGDFIGSNPDERSILLMETPLRLFHVTPDDLQHVPCSADGSQPWPRHFAQRVKGSGIDDPYNPIQNKGTRKQA